MRALALCLCLLASCAVKQAPQLHSTVQRASGLGKLHAPFVHDVPQPLDFAFAVTSSRQFRFEILHPLTMQTVFACGSNGQDAWWWEQGKARHLTTRKLSRVFQQRTQVKLEDFLLQLLNKSSQGLQLSFREWKDAALLDPRLFSAYE